VVVIVVAVVGEVVVAVAVAVAVAVVGAVVAVVVVVGTEGEAVVAVVADGELPLSDAITASATPMPITTATSSTIAAFIPVLMPPPRGGSSPGSLMTRVGSSCMAARV
jgi:hypothetical protein